MFDSEFALPWVVRDVSLGWGATRGPDEEVRDPDARWFGGICACVNDGSVRCIGTGRRAVASVEERSVGECASVAGGPYGGCATSVAGRVRCWGEPLDAPGVDALRDIVQVEVSREHACARDTRGGVFCWGIDWLGETSGPRSTSLPESRRVRRVPDVTARSISVGALRSCALVEGGISCWGWDPGESCFVSIGSTSVATADPACRHDRPILRLGGDFVAVESGNANTCGLTVTGVVRCNGVPYIGPTPPGYKTFYTGWGSLAQHAIGKNVALLAMGENSMCVLSTSGLVSCWGPINGAPLVALGHFPGSQVRTIHAPDGEPCLPFTAPVPDHFWVEL